MRGIELSRGGFGQRHTDVCEAVEPQLTEYAGGHLAACHHPQHVTADAIAGAGRSATSPLSAGEEAPAVPASSPG